MRRHKQGYEGAGAVLLVLAAAAPPALAQTQAQPRIAIPSIVPAIDEECRRSRSRDEIVVCGRLQDEVRPRYRLPEEEDRGFDPRSGIDSVSRERHRLMEGGETGIHSCSTVGPGGYTGCTFMQWERGDQQWGGVPRSKRRSWERER